MFNETPNSSFDKFDNQDYLRYATQANIARDLKLLKGIIVGINSDGNVNSIELTQLREWMKSLSHLRDRQPYNELITVLEEAISDDNLDKEEKENILWLINNYVTKSGYYDVLTAGIQELIGLIQGISFDHEINQKEIEHLLKWLEKNSYLENTYPYDELNSILLAITADGIITKEEHDLLLGFCQSFLPDHLERSVISDLKLGFCQIDPMIQLTEKTFCITGNSKKFKRREIANQIELFGGFVSNNLNLKVDYLVVCDDNNSCWAFKCYGRKIEAAVNLRKKGHQVNIIHELDLYDAFEDA